MAEKEQEGVEEQPQKKGMLPLVMIVVGAVLGGAGVVFGMPKKDPVQDEHTETVPKTIKVHLENNPMDFTFNPKSSAGKSFGQITFTFEYEVLEEDYEESLSFVRDYWKRAKSAVLDLVRNRHIQEFNDNEGFKLIERDIIDELTYQLFPGPRDERIAEVFRINWQKVLVQ